MTLPQMPELAGVEHEWIEARGARFHIATAGSGEPLVLLHTSFQHWWAWRHAIGGLAERHRVICPDLRGCGWSDAPSRGYGKEEMAADVVALLDALGLDRVRLIGHGFGGLIGFLLCLAHPERVERYLAVGIVHPWPRVDARFAAGMWRSWYQAAVAFPGLGPRLAAQRTFLDWMFRRTSPHPELWSPEDVDSYAAVLADRDRGRAVSRAYRTFLAREFLPLARGRYRGTRLRPPTRILFGTRDHFFPPRALEGYEPYADSLEVELAPGEGHFIPEENPELLRRSAAEFLEARSEVKA